MVKSMDCKDKMEFPLELSFRSHVFTGDSTDPSKAYILSLALSTGKRLFRIEKMHTTSINLNSYYIYF